MTLKSAIELLKQAKIDSPEYDARELFKLFIPLPTLSSECDDPRLISMLQRRADREPLQYIIGEVGFYREVYRVTPDCLIPRSDTEILVDYAVKNIPRGESFLDLCTGSGCVAISTLCNTRDTHAVAVDISDGALKVAKENAEKNCVIDRIEFVSADVMKDEIRGEFFALLSNPPYVADEVYRALEKEIFHEPRIAFVGGVDGGDFYRRLTPMYKNRIQKEGFIAYEIGYDQGEMLKNIAKDNDMSCEILRDLSGNDRVAVLRPQK